MLTFTNFIYCFLYRKNKSLVILQHQSHRIQVCLFIVQNYLIYQLHLNNQVTFYFYDSYRRNELGCYSRNMISSDFWCNVNNFSENGWFPLKESTAQFFISFLEYNQSFLLKIDRKATCFKDCSKEIKCEIYCKKSVTLVTYSVTIYCFTSVFIHKIFYLFWNIFTYTCLL